MKLIKILKFDNLVIKIYDNQIYSLPYEWKVIKDGKTSHDPTSHSSLNAAIHYAIIDNTDLSLFNDRPLKINYLKHRRKIKHIERFMGI